MSQDEFTKLFKIVMEISDRLNDTLTKDEFIERHDRLTNLVDAYAKRVDDYTQEMLMLAHKVDRLEKWINQLAAQANVRLEY